MTDAKQPLSPSPGASTKHFQDMVRPVPGLVRRERPKPFVSYILHRYAFLPIALFMIALGVALEAALSVSQDRNGFSVPEKNVLSFVSQNFLITFIPVCFVIPIAIAWKWVSRDVQLYQPYISLLYGNAIAENSLLLNYLGYNSLFVIFISFFKRHWMVFVCALGALSSYMYQPLAGAIFAIHQVPEPSNSTVQSTRTLGLDPNRFDYSNFFAAAGYVFAAVTNGLPDPPFIHTAWATADFNFTVYDSADGTVSVNTTGIRTNATCSAPASLQLTPINSTASLISSTSSSGCSANVTFSTAQSAQSYGVVGVRNCVQLANSNATFLPVFFWFSNSGLGNANNSATQAAGVFCNPTLEVLSVNAVASLRNGSLLGATILSPITGGGNNVTGNPQNGLPFNGVIFDPTSDPIASTRATATNIGVPSAIFRAVQLDPLLSATAFATLDGFVQITSKVYTQHLSLVAKNTYFLDTDETFPSTVLTTKPRLVIEALAGHALAALLFVTGIVMLIIGFVHRHMRHGLFLAMEPGSIAGAVALTARSGFGSLLVPYDTHEDITEKLSSLRFAFNIGTGAVVAADRNVYDREINLSSDPVMPETSETLLSSGRPGGTPLPYTNYYVEPFVPPYESSARYRG